MYTQEEVKVSERSVESRVLSMPGGVEEAVMYVGRSLRGLFSMPQRAIVSTSIRRVT